MNDPPKRTVGSFWRPGPNAPGRLLPVALVLRLQRTVGNREVGRLLLARHSAPAPEEPHARAPLSAWIYVLAAVIAAGIGSAAAVLFHASREVLIGVVAAAAALGAGVAYLADRGRRTASRRKK